MPEDRQAAAGKKKLEQVASTLRSSGNVDPVPVRDLLSWFGSQYRGIRINRVIRAVLRSQNLHIEPNINEVLLDGLVEFKLGLVIDETERQFYSKERVMREGSIPDEVEAAMLNKIYIELFSDCLAGWLDRNSKASEEDIQSKIAELKTLEIQEFEEVEQADVLVFPSSFRVGRRSSRVSESDRPISRPQADLLTVLQQDRKRLQEIRSEQDRLAPLYVAIGKFIYEFSQLEFKIRHALGSALGVTDEYLDVISGFDFSLLCNVSRAFFIRFVNDPGYDSKELDRLLSECRKINDERVRIAHGTWFLDELGFGARHVSRQSLKPEVYYQTTDELNEKILLIQNLALRVEKFMIAPISAGRRSPQ